MASATASAASAVHSEAEAGRVNSVLLTPKPYIDYVALMLARRCVDYMPPSEDAERARRTAEFQVAITEVMQRIEERASPR